MENENSDLKKEIKVYTIELLVFSVVFLVLGILILLHVWMIKGTFRKVMVWVSFFCSLILIGTFFWTLFSRKHRKKASLLDKALALPVALAVLGMDIATFILGVEETNEFHQTFVGILFLYIAVVYVIQALYHYRHPVPLLLSALGEEEGKPAKPLPIETPEEEKKDEENFLSRLKKKEEEKK